MVIIRLIAWQMSHTLLPDALSVMLLQAVDLELAKLEESTNAHTTYSEVLPSAGAMSDEQMRTALQQLRVDVLDQWDAT